MERNVDHERVVSPKELLQFWNSLLCAVMQLLIQNFPPFGTCLDFHFQMQTV